MRVVVCVDAGRHARARASPPSRPSPSISSSHVEVGVAVAALLTLGAVARNANAVAERIPTSSDGVTPAEEDALLEEHILTYRLDGALFFGAAQRFLAELTAVDGVKVVILPRCPISRCSPARHRRFSEIVRRLKVRGITVLIKGVRPDHLRVLEAVGVLDRLAHERHLFDNLDDAIAHARAHVRHATHDAA